MRSTIRRIASGFGIALVLIATIAILGMPQVLAQHRQSAIIAVKGVTVDHLLDPDDFTALGGAIGEDLAVTPTAVILSAGGALRSLDRNTSGGKIAKIAGGLPTSFAADTKDATLLTVADGYFGLLNEADQFTHSIPVPYSDSHLAPSIHPGTTYLFAGADHHYRLYQIREDGGMSILLESDVPVAAATDDENWTYAATAREILRIKPGRPNVLFQAPDALGPIKSVAATPDGLILFSTPSRVFAVLNGNAVSLVNNAGGTLRFDNGLLYVLDQNRKMLFTMGPIASNLFGTRRD
jgi:hypothetical protein